MGTRDERLQHWQNADVTIFGDAVTVPVDTEAASWIKAHLGDFGTVGGLVPGGFDRYLLVRPTSIVDGGVDETEQTAAIAGVALRHTTTPEMVWFAIWEGYGWASSSTTLYFVSGRGLRFVRTLARLRARASDRRRRRRILRGLARIPRFDLPNRGYHLICGPIQAAACITEPGASRLQVPDLWWPDDRSWFVATDTDLDWIYVGGSQGFITEVIEAHPGRTEFVERTDDNNQHA